jgi:hypothetical protein
LRKNRRSSQEVLTAVAVALIGVAGNLVQGGSRGAAGFSRRLRERQRRGPRRRRATARRIGLLESGATWSPGCDTSLACQLAGVLMPAFRRSRSFLAVSLPMCHCLPISR